MLCVNKILVVAMVLSEEYSIEPLVLFHSYFFIVFPIH